MSRGKIPRVASGLHSEDSVIDIESGLPTEAEVPESPEPPVSEPPNAVITPDGVQELPPWLIGSDGKPLPINERTLRLIRGKTFTVRHILLTCGHKMDLQNQPKTGCETCWWEWLNNHSTLVQTAHEFYQQFGKERLVAMRGAKFVKYFLVFMSTVAHMIEEQKKQEAANGNSHRTNSWSSVGSREEADGKEAPSKPLTAEEKLKLAKSVTTQLNNEYKDGGILVQKMGKRSTSRWPSLSTDLPTFDELVLGCGGMPDGRIIEIYGPESAGKTAFSLHVIGCAQRAGGLALFVDAEHALDMNHARTLGVDVDNLIISQPDYGEQALEVVLAFVRSRAVRVIVVD